tara:strand:+ start:634 stop:1128 length:495 start_codon:yes stop_codon:yes gene_type:complete
MYIKSIYDIDICTPSGKIVRMRNYEGSIVMVVNIASECGFNQQLREMEICYQYFKDEKFTILGFPSDQFNQEPLEDDEIIITHEQRFQVTFPLFNKILVNGKHAHPLFQYLSQKLPGIFGSQSIKWNFTKFIIDRDGTPLKRFSPITHIDAVSEYVETLIENEQ